MTGHWMDRKEHDCDQCDREVCEDGWCEECHSDHTDCEGCNN